MVKPMQNDDYDLDFYENAIQVRETLMADKSPSGTEAKAFQQQAADEELQRSKEYYQKKGTPTMPLPERFNYDGVDDVDNIQLGKYRAKNQYFAGTDVATGVKDLNSVLDTEPGYDDDQDSNMFADLFDRAMSSVATVVGKGEMQRRSNERMAKGAIWNVHEMLQSGGLTIAEGAAELLTPEELAMDENKAKAFWEAQREAAVGEMPEDIKPRDALEGMAQDMLAYMAPYVAVAKSIGMFKAIKEGRYVGAAVRDAIASAILAQGYDPKEGTLSTVLREAGFGEDILQYTDSKASYENDGRWAGRLALTMEEVGLTALPASVAILGLSGYKGIQRMVRKERQQTLTELMESMPKATINSKGEPANERSGNILRGIARAYVDDGASYNDFITENAGAHSVETLEKAWNDAAKDKELFNKAAATYLNGPRDMAAVHAINVTNLRRAIRNQGIPAPSIGIVKDTFEDLEGFGDWMLVLNHSAFNPEFDILRNVVTREDMWSEMMPAVHVMNELAGKPSSLRSMTLGMTQQADPRGVVSMGAFNPHLVSSKVHGFAQNLDEIRARRGEYGPATIRDADGEPIALSPLEMNNLIYEQKNVLHERLKEFTHSMDWHPAITDNLLMDITDELADTRVTEVPEKVIKKAMRDNKIEPTHATVALTKELMENSINIPIRYMEGKPQKSLKFGPGQDIQYIIAPSELEGEDEEVIKQLTEMGIEVIKDDGSGLGQIPDSFKFAMPPVMAAMLADEEEEMD